MGHEAMEGSVEAERFRLLRCFLYLSSLITIPKDTSGRT